MTAQLDPLHLDAAPMGDLGGTYGVLVQTSPGVDLVLHAACDGREFTADTRQFRQILGDVPLDTPEMIAFLTEFVRENFRGDLAGKPACVKQSTMATAGWRQRALRGTTVQAGGI